MIDVRVTPQFDLAGLADGAGGVLMEGRLFGCERCNCTGLADAIMAAELRTLQRSCCLDW